MESTLLLIVSILFVVSLLSLLSERLGIAYPIFLVIAGLIISMVPNVPRISLQSDLVFVIFLPPLLFSAAWNTSWKEFWFYRRPISLLAFGLVIITSGIIAYVSHAIIPGFPLAHGFLLGGIISPPDAIAATTVFKNLKVPRRALIVLEGESLVNDATSLIVFRFALVTVFTGQFVMWRAGIDFLMVVVMGISIGLAIALIVRFIKHVISLTPSIATAISLIAPYLMYITAEHLGFSGVLAVVSGGLYMGYHAQDIYTYDARMQMQSVWDTLVFLMNGVVFILIGLQLPGIMEGIEKYSIQDAIRYGVVISLTAILVRIVWIFPATYLPRILSPYVRRQEANPGWKSVFIVAWSGMRGVVSLASALTIPLTLSNGAIFPYRNLILFITFCVILFTLVLQGLSLPFIIRALKIKIPDTEAKQRLAIHHALSLAALEHMKKAYPEQIGSNPIFNAAKNRYEKIVEMAGQLLQESERENGREGDGVKHASATSAQYYQMLIELITVQRDELRSMRRENTYMHELLRDKEFELDLEEARLRRLAQTE